MLLEPNMKRGHLEINSFFLKDVQSSNNNMNVVIGFLLSVEVSSDSTHLRELRRKPSSLIR